MADSGDSESKKEEDFWVTYEDRLGSKLPSELKSILTFMGYDCKAAMMKFCNDDIPKIEQFVKTKLHHLIDESQKEKYYGIFYKKPEMFKIMGGFLHVLESLAEFARRPSMFSSVQCKKINHEAATGKKVSVQQKESTASEENVLKEANRLHSMLNKWLEENIKDIEVDYETVPIKVQRDNFGGLSCRIECPVAECKVISVGSKSGSRWSHNFYRHIKTHKKRKRNSQGTLCKLLIKKKKTDGAEDTISIPSDDENEKETTEKEMEGGNRGKPLEIFVYNDY